MFPSPFASLSKKSEKKLTTSLISLLLMGGLTMVYFNGFLINKTAPFGMISLELSKTIEQSKAIINSWGELARTVAGLSLGLDFLFLLIYTLFISLIIHKLTERIWKNEPVFYRVGGAFIWLLFITAMCDAIENIALIKLVLGSHFQLWTSVAFYTTALKFLFIILALLFIIVNTAFLLIKKPIND